MADEQKITPYGKDIEPNVPDAKSVMESFRRLADIVGIDSVGWRYDPILIDSTHTVEWHLSKFEKMAAILSGYTRPCAEGDDLAVYGADCSGCMTVATFENALHNRLVIPKRKQLIIS